MKRRMFVKQLALSAAVAAIGIGSTNLYAQGKTIKREAWDNLNQFLSPFQIAAQELRRGTPVRP